LEYLGTPLVEQFLDFMLSLSKARNPLIQEFVEEFDKLFLAFSQVRSQLKNDPSQFQSLMKPFQSETLSRFIRIVELDITNIESQEKYFASVQTMVNVNIPLEIPLQDALRLSEKKLQLCLNHVHQLLKEKKEQNARELLRLMIVFAPDYPHLWILQGILLMKENLWEEATKSLIFGIIQSPFSLHGLIPLIEVSQFHDKTTHTELLKWFNTHKHRLVIDSDTPPFYKKAVIEGMFPKKEEILQSLPKGLGNRYSYQIQKQEFQDLARNGFPKSLLAILHESFDDNFETISSATVDPTLRFFLKIIQKSPSEIDRTVSKQNLYLHSLTLTSRGFFLGLKIVKQGLFSKDQDTPFTKDVLSGSLILSFLFTLLILLKQEKNLLIDGKEPFKEILYFMVNTLPLISQTRSLPLIDALIIDIIERI
jgi:hypothetical protein